MNVERSVADVLNDHVVVEVEGIDRMNVNVYVPGLQQAAGLHGYLRRQPGSSTASTPSPTAAAADRR